MQVANTEFRSLSGEARQQVLELRDRYDAVWREVVTQGRAYGDVSGAKCQNWQPLQ